ncbi:MAG: ABC transporter permease [Actinobacteria bacterium]|nr:ABC transporter permease [Actinomycetota bacterium]NCW94404.1 ABC transporter permease [Actinomycetota bacterium]NCX35906.1 ABC transporter permease [Actinomycetota bacterium]
MSASPSAQTDFVVEEKTQWRTILHRFRRHRLAVVSVCLLLTIFLASIFSRYIWRFDYLERDTLNLSQPPSLSHPFGTDSLGKDMLALTLRGSQRSILIAIVVSVLSTTVGVVIGSISGYFRGAIDAVLMRITDLLLTIPLLILAGTIAWQFDGGGSWWFLALLLGSLSWQGTARIVRGEFLALREREFVEAARAIGVSDLKIVFRHILPNAVGPIIVSATLSIASAILVETALSYLGLGIKAPDSSLGLLVSDYQAAFQTRPWLFWFPGLFIVVICLSVNFVGDGLRDAFDPKQTRVRR